MTSASVESRSWSQRRCWGMIGLIFGVQLILIFWLGEASPIRPRPAAQAFTFKLAGSASAELLALHDPTMFALPHPQLVAPRPEFHPFVWSEPTNYLLPPIDQLGASFDRFVETSTFNSLPPPAKPLPDLTTPELPALPASAEHSTVRLEWDQAPRRLLTPLELRSWVSPDILTNSVVQIVVGAEGTPASVTLLSGSGSRAADQEALEQANAARFEPLGRNPLGTALNPVATLSWGRMIFRWHTLPPPPTNAPAASP
jgi:TonB family protein